MTEIRVGTPSPERRFSLGNEGNGEHYDRPVSPAPSYRYERSLSRSESLQSFELLPRYGIGTTPPSYHAQDLFPQLRLAQACNSRVWIGFGGVLVMLLVGANMVGIASQVAREQAQASCQRLVQLEPERCLNALPFASVPSAACLQDCIHRPSQVLQRAGAPALLPPLQGELTLAGGVLLGALSVTLLGALAGVLYNVYRVSPASSGADHALDV